MKARKPCSPSAADAPAARDRLRLPMPKAQRSSGSKTVNSPSSNTRFLAPSASTAMIAISNEQQLSRSRTWARRNSRCRATIRRSWPTRSSTRGAAWSVEASEHRASAPPRTRYARTLYASTLSRSFGVHYERPDLLVRFPPRRGFHPAGDVHTIRPYLGHSIGHILRRQSSRKKNRAPQLLRLNGQLPIELLARTTPFIGRERIEQPSLRLVSRKVCQRGRVTHAKRLHAHQPELQAVFRGLLSMELQQVQPAFCDGPEYLILLRVNEQAHLDDE